MSSTEQVFNLMDYLPNVSSHYFTVVLLFLSPIPVGLISTYITNKTVRLWFTILTSFIFQWMCFQEYVLHSVASIIISWIFINYLPYPQAHYITLLFNFSYLLYGHAWRMYNYYLVYSTDWTILQMMLLVRLTSVSWYRSLSYRPKHEIRPKHQQYILYDHISITELFAYCWHLPGMLIGPNIPYTTFLEFLDLSMFPNKTIPNTIKQKDFYIRLIELIFIFLCGVTDPLDVRYMTTTEFFNQSLGYRIGYYLLAHYTNMSKYLFMFVVGEMACVGCGISYYTDEKGEQKFCKFRNIRLTKILTARGLRMFSANWNLGTVDWITSVINDIVPTHWPELARHGTTYIINAFWHGFYPGYLLFFFCCGIPYEFCSRGFLKIINTYINKSSKLYYLWQIAGFISSLALMMFAALSFHLMSFELSLKSWGNWYYYYFIMLGLMYILHFIIPPLPADYWQKATKQSTKKNK
ncbi:Mboat family protein [Entamoeba marina]